MRRLAYARILPITIAALCGPLLSARELPSDTRIQTGTLANGVKWMWRQHDNPPGKMAIWIHVASGSLNETERQRGLAHFLEHLAFNGSENFAPGELIPYFEGIGMKFGPDVNAHTSFDHTAYKLYLPDTTVGQFDQGMMVLSDYAFRMLLLPEEIEKERGVILSELTAGRGPQQRLRDKFFEQVLAGSRISRRLPIGLVKVIKNATEDDFKAYYRTWYRPENVTVMVVGDAPSAAYLPIIEKWFGEYEAAVPTQTSHTAELEPFTEERAFVFTDEEYSDGDVEVYGLAAGRPPTTTVEQYRQELVEYLGSWIIGRRFSERIKKGKATYRSARASTFTFLNDALLSNASATGRPEDWEKMLEELIMDVHQAREHGFLPQELKLAKRELLADAERAVKTEATRNARRFIMQMNRHLNSHEPILSAAQELELNRKILTTIELKEVDRAFAEHFTPGAFAYVLTLPQRDDLTIPSPDELLAAARAAEARTVSAPVWEQRPTEILDSLPQPGRVVDSKTDPDLEITSAWLENGVRVHHRFMDYKKDTVLVSITLAGGEIEETTANAGITTVAALALKQPATGRLTSTDIRDILTGMNINVSGGAEGDTFTLTVSGSPKDLESGLQLAHALLTDGKIETSAFDTWKQRTVQRYEQLVKIPRYHAVKALINIMSGGDPRRAMWEPERIEAQSVERSQAWLERLCRQAPIEVAVVGELALDAAMPLVERYIGSLPPRPRSAAHLETLRTLPRQAGPHKRSLKVESITPQAWAFAGFVGCESVEVADVRAMDLAASMLDSRLIKRIREELGIVYSIGAINQPAVTYHDAGLFASSAPCAPGTSGDVVDEVQAIFATFAEDGPTAEELENAKKQIKNRLDTQLKEPSYWFGQLQALDLHKMRLADMKDIPASYEAITAEQVTQTFRKYHRPERLFAVAAEPESTQTTPAETDKNAVAPGIQ